MTNTTTATRLPLFRRGLASLTERLLTLKRGVLLPKKRLLNPRNSRR
jgi:hypothetical protein